MADKDFKGVIIPILTPLKSDETVDVPSLKRLVNYLIDSGVHGIWVSGTTGEFAQLTDSERIRSVEAVVDEVAGRVPVIGNVSGASTQLSINLALEVQEMGLDGIAVTPPYYYPNAQDEVLDHYRHIRSRVGTPLWVYNIPQTVKTAVAPGTVATLASEGAVVGVKDSSGAGELLAELNVLCEQGGLSLLRFLGTSYRMTVAMGVGVQGVIPGRQSRKPRGPRASSAFGYRRAVSSPRRKPPTSVAQRLSSQGSMPPAGRAPSPGRWRAATSTSPARANETCSPSLIDHAT